MKTSRSKIVCLLTLGFLLGSCASALKKKCEATNWFEHGRTVALSGRRLNSDDFVQRCIKEKVDVNEAQVDLGFKSGMGLYCTGPGARDTGRKGDRLNPELCDPAVFSALEKEWNKGVAEYCTPGNAYKVGALGEEYKGVCPEGAEAAFKEKFNRGKFVYYGNMIDAKELEASKLQRRKADSDRSLQALDRQRATLMASQKLLLMRRRAPDPEQDANYESEKSTLDSRIRSEQYNIRKVDSDIDKLRAEITDLKIKRGAFAE